MSPIMEVLEGASRSTPNGASSPPPHESSLAHLELGGISPSRNPLSHEVIPERGVSPSGSPQGELPLSQGKEEAPQSPGYPNPYSNEPVANADEAASQDYQPDQCNIHPEPHNLVTSNDEPLPEGEDRGVEEEEGLEVPKPEEETRLSACVTPLQHNPLADTPQEDQTLPQVSDPNSNYSLHSPGGEVTRSPLRDEEGLTYPRSNEAPSSHGHTEGSQEERHPGLDPSQTQQPSQPQPLPEPGSHLSSEELQQQHLQKFMGERSHHPLQEPPMDEHPLDEHPHPLQSQQYNEQPQPPCVLQDYPGHPMLKMPLHLQDHMREPHGPLHDYDDQHPSHPLADQRHLQETLGEPAPPHHQHPSERSHEGYWNMHLGMLSKVKSETKDWYERDGLIPEPLGNPGLLKSSEQHDLYNYRVPSHPSMGSESPISGPRPSPLPHGSLPFTQSPDQRQHQAPPQHPGQQQQQQPPQQHYQPYQNHSGLRDMSPMSPGYPSHPRGHLQASQHHGASQLSGGPPHALHHPSQHHLGTQHIQQYGGQQYGGQQQMNLQGHPGQQLPSPYAQGIMGPGMGGPGGHHRPHEGREGREGDPYSFVDECTGPPPRPVEEILGHAQPKRRGRKPKHIKLMENGGDPLAIAAAQAAHEAKKRKWRQMGPDGKPLPLPVKPRKRIDRFDGISEDELSKKILPDHLGPNLDIVIISKFPFQIGINPGLFAAYKGHHYAGPGNHFWKMNEDLTITGKCLFLSGLIPEPLTSDDDHQLLDHGIGFTNIVARTTRGSAELTRKEIKEGGQILLAKLQRFQPRVAVFNGKGIYEIFSGKKEFTFGRQPEKIEGTHTHVWVMPSSSARCAQLPRALDKVPFYTALRKFRDFLKGTIAELTEEEITFSCPKTNKHLKEIEKLEGPFEDELPDPFLDDPLKDDLESPRFESELDSEEISRSISQSLYNLSGMTRDQLEALDCPTIPIRKKRGRPKKSPDDPNAPSRPKPRSFPTELLLCNGEEPPRKKRGRPKKVLEDGTIPPPKRPGRKPKALKEMLAAQQASIGAPGGIQQNPHAQMGMGHLNGMMSPSGYNSNPGGPPFSPQFGGPQMHPMNGPNHPDLLSSVHGVGNPSGPHGINNHPGLTGGHNSMHGSHGPLHSNPGGLPLHSGNSLHPQGCPTPNSNSGPHTPSHNSLPPRGPTPQGYVQSPGYSPSPIPNHLHHLGSAYSQHSEKSDLQLEEERQFGLSPIPASPVMAQPDFEPPSSLPEGEPLMGENRVMSQGPPEDSQLLLDRQQQHTPSIQSTFSNPSTPADDSAPPYQGYPSYPPTTSCSPSYNSPSYPPGVSHSPSYPPSVSCSPSYTPHNTHSPSSYSKSTHSPSYPHSISHSPSYPPNNNSSNSNSTSTHSPSYPRNATQSPSYPHPNPSRSPSYPPPPNQSPSFPQVSQSPSYPSNTTHSPSYPHSISHSPSYSTLTRSPSSYPSNLTHSPSYPPNSTQSPSYRPPTSQSPSFSSGPSHPPSLNKPLVPPGVNSPQMKNDVSSKSLSGLESLVDQIPSLSEADPSTGAAQSLPGGSIPNGPCSNPTTPGPPSDPFSPGGHGPQQQNTSYPSFPPGGGGSFTPSHYGSPQPQAPPPNPYSPQYTSSSTNMSTNFSVSSLASSSITTTHSYEVNHPHHSTTPCSTTSSNSSCNNTTTTTITSPSSTSSSSNTTSTTSSASSSFSVSSLTAGSPTPTPSMYSNNSYSPAPPGPSPQSYDIMGSSILPPTPPMGPSFMGASGMSPSMGTLPGSMNMPGSQLPYPYSQYGDSGPGGYNTPGPGSFPYSTSSPGFPLPSPRFPYPSPYSSGPYSQGYSQNAMLERIKQTGMGMGYGGY